MQLLTETLLQYYTHCCLIEKTKFWEWPMFHKISTNSTVKFGNACFFKDMVSCEHEFFRQLLLVYFHIQLSESEITWYFFFHVFYSLQAILQLWGIAFSNFNTRSTASKVSKYGVSSGPYLLVLRMTTVKYGPEITLYLDTIHAVKDAENAVQ